MHRYPPVGAAEPDRPRLQRRTLRVLVGAQVLGGTATGAGAAVSPLLAEEILGDGTLAGLAFAALVFGGAVGALVLSRTMARHGRRPGLAGGYAVASSGATVALAAAEFRSFALLLVAMLLFGAGNAAGLLARYAGADLADPERRARGIATVVWATTIGAATGPTVLGPAGRLAAVVGLPRMAGPYVIAMLAFAGAALVVWTLLRPDPLAVGAASRSAPGPAGRPSVAREFRRILSNRFAGLAVATMAIANGVMVAVMTMTPLHLRDGGHSLEVVGAVISLHIVGLYAFAPVFGTIADRVGPVRMAQRGALTLVTATVLAAGAGQHRTLIGLALVLLGLGWSMATISGAALLTTSVSVELRASAQGTADMTMGVVAGVAGTVSGVVVGTVGFPAVSLVGAVIATTLLAFLVAYPAHVGRRGRLGRRALHRSWPARSGIRGSGGQHVRLEADA